MSKVWIRAIKKSITGMGKDCKEKVKTSYCSSSKPAMLCYAAVASQWLFALFRHIVSRGVKAKALPRLNKSLLSHALAMITRLATCPRISLCCAGSVAFDVLPYRVRPTGTS